VVSDPRTGSLALARPFLAPAGTTAQACAMDAPAALSDQLQGARRAKLIPRRADATASLTYRATGGAGAAELGGFTTDGVAAHIDAGEVSFTCSDGDHGYEFAATLEARSRLFSQWQIWSLDGYLTRSAVATSQEVLGHLASTFQLDPTWASQQGQQAVATAQIVTQAGQQIANGLNESFWNRQEVNAQLANTWSNTILGQQDMVNPDTGETYKVASGHDYYWQGDDGQLYAGNSATPPPDIDVTQLDNVPAPS